MKQMLAAIALAITAAGAFAADVAPPAPAPSVGKTLTPQQQKMSDCATANKGKKGADYKAGVKACLSGTPAAASAPMTQQQKMSACSKANKGKKGDDYKAGVKACLAA